MQVYAGPHPANVKALIVEDVGPERPASIANGFARQVEQDAAGWNSEDELLAQLKKSNATVSEEQLRAYAHFGTKPAPGGRIVWKRDPNLARGFIETELWQYIRKITSPTIYVIGGRSTIVPAETQVELKKTIPGVEIVTMPGLGHLSRTPKRRTTSSTSRRASCPRTVDGHKNSLSRSLRNQRVDVQHYRSFSRCHFRTPNIRQHVNGAVLAQQFREVHPQQIAVPLKP